VNDSIFKKNAAATPRFLFVLRPTSPLPVIASRLYPRFAARLPLNETILPRKSGPNDLIT
jgi:hypothetical protein